MDQKQLIAIKERVAKATPGPWVIEESRFGSFNAASVDENYDLTACLMKANDADFVTNSREDVPALLAEVERLRTLADFEVRCSIKANQENKRLQEIINDTKSDILSIGSTIAEAGSYGETLDMGLLSDKLHEMFLRLDGESND